MQFDLSVVLCKLESISHTTYNALWTFQFHFVQRVGSERNYKLISTAADRDVKEK